LQRAVDSLESLHKLEPQDSYQLACNLALCIPLVGLKNGHPGTPQELSKSDQRRQQLLGNRAIESLRKSLADGFFGAQTIESEPDFNALRSRSDFNALVKAIEDKSANTEK
jgi:hypothetical protein